MSIETRLISSLEKVFSDEGLSAPSWESASALQGEFFSFQFCARPEDGDRIFTQLRVDSPLADYVKLYAVGQVPSTLPAYDREDDYHLRKTPGLYPDPLFPYEDEWRIVGKQWRSMWVEVSLPEGIPAGVYPIRLTLVNKEQPQETLAEEVFMLEVIGTTLPKQKLIHTEWFHCDCLAVHYGVPVFSEVHWSLIRNYLQNAVRYGVNMLLTPVFTPPLDTEIGTERPTVQLVDVTVLNGKYSFGFDRLKQFMDLAADCGIAYFEISHLFTQWGAEHAPKIIATVDGIKKQIFGWETSSVSTEYTSFLQFFLWELKAFLITEGRLDSCYFHISDEPSLGQIESYRAARESVSDALRGCHVMDALSDYEFYRSGLVPHPIPANNHIEEFIQNGVPDLWTYYCCGQTVAVSNRMMAMPSARNRILGWQLYQYQIRGFLQWGYNFWFSRLSKRVIDPYYVTDADDAFPSGDAFLVYPGDNAVPVPSIRQLVFHEALQDLRALELLGSLTSREEVCEWINEHCESAMTFFRYPRGAKWILEMREMMNQKIKGALKTADRPHRPSWL